MLDKLKYTTETGTAITRAHPTDAGADLRTPYDVTIHPGEMEVIDTGIAVAIPAGHVGLVFVRSSMGMKRRCTLANGTGVIDQDYRGTIKVAVVNGGHEDVELEAGERVAQLVIVPCATPVPQAVDTLDETGRGMGGVGSTGRL